jgi:hypothetical protein
LNRLGLGLLALLCFGGVALLLVALAGDGDGSPGPGAVRPGEPRGAGAVEPRGPATLADPAGSPTAPGDQPGLGATTAPERSAARHEVPAGLPRDTHQVLSGRVIAEEQRPLEGAQVQYGTRDGGMLAEDTTDRSGAFTLAAPYPLEDGRILVRARGYAPLLNGPHAVRAGERKFVGNLRLIRGVMLAGQVTDPSGAPLEDARVEVREDPTHGGRNEHTLVATTDPDGMFRVPDAPLGPIVVAAHAAGYGSQLRQMNHQAATDRITVAIGVERPLVVRVEDDRGTPVPGAEIQLRPHAPQSPLATATTGASGVAQVAGLASETWELRVEAAGYRIAMRDRVTAPGDVTIELGAWPCIRGRVTQPQGEPPPAGTQVRALAADARGAFVEAGTAVPQPVEADGSFALCDLRPGLYAVQADAPGWAPTRSGPQRLTVGRDAAEVAIELTAGTSVDVLVQVGSAPSAGVRCELWRHPPPPTELWRTAATPAAVVDGAVYTATTGGQGHALFTNVAPGQLWCLARKEGLLPLVHGPIVVGRDGTTRAGPLRLEEGGRLRGTLAGLPAGAGQTVVNLFGQDGVTQNAPVLVLAGEDGAWTSPLLPPGRYRVTARVVAGDPPRAHTAAAQETIERGKTARVELELR